MNILQIISSPASGGAEVYVKDLAKYLASEGHNMHIAFLSNAVDIGRDLYYQEEFIADLNSKGISTFFIGNEARKKPWLGVIKLRQYIKKNNIEICHSHLAYGVFFHGLSKVPLVYTYHQSTPRWNKLTYKALNLLVDSYVGISKQCSLNLSQFTGKPVTQINNGVSCDKFHHLTRIRKLDDKLRICMVGRLTPQKDYFNMLNALNLLEPTVKSKIEVRIAGEGTPKYTEEIREYIRQLNLEDTVYLVGVQQNIPQFLYESDLFLMSSIFEGLPIALIEATISGLPCIVTNVGGCVEVIEDCKNGIAVPAEDPNAIANAINDLIKLPTKLQAYSMNAIENSKVYCIDNAAKQHIDLYSSLIN